MTGLVAYGSYVPHYRLARAEIARTLNGGTATGTRTVAGYDEDMVSMAVEAARPALRAIGGSVRIRRLLLATATPPYLDKTNANVVHAALRLDPDALAIDVAGSVRSGVGALAMGWEASIPTLVVLSDVRTGLPGGADERDGGDAAAAFVFGGGDPIATLVAHATVTEEFLDRWRMPGEPASRVWEERFGEQVYVRLGASAFDAALAEAGIAASDVDTLIVAGMHTRAVDVFGGRAGVEKVASTLMTSVGNSGTAHPGLLLAHALDAARPEQTIALVVLADGASAFVLRTTAALESRRATPSVAGQIAAGDDSVRYTDFLTWRGMLAKEPPRRPEPNGPCAPPTLRAARYKFGFVACRCDVCGTIHLPPVRVCVGCGALDRMSVAMMHDAVGTIATFTIDHLTFSPNPPLIMVVVDFDGGGRLSCELTDAADDEVRVGDRVSMTFRRVSTAGGIHNYFWKARPLTAQAVDTEQDNAVVARSEER